MRFIKLLSAVIPLSIMISAPVQARDWASVEKSARSWPPPKALSLRSTTTKAPN